MEENKIDWDAALKDLCTPDGQPPVTDKLEARQTEDGKFEIHAIFGQQLNMTVVQMAVQLWEDAGLPMEPKWEDGPLLPKNEKLFAPVRTWAALHTLADLIRATAERMLGEHQAETGGI